MNRRAETEAACDFAAEWWINRLEESILRRVATRRQSWAPGPSDLAALRETLTDMLLHELTLSRGEPITLIVSAHSAGGHLARACVQAGWDMGKSWIFFPMNEACTVGPGAVTAIVERVVEAEYSLDHFAPQRIRRSVGEYWANEVEGAMRAQVAAGHREGGTVPGASAWGTFSGLVDQQARLLWKGQNRQLEMGVRGGGPESPVIIACDGFMTGMLEACAHGAGILREGDVPVILYGRRTELRQNSLTLTKIGAEPTEILRGGIPIGTELEKARQRWDDHWSLPEGAGRTLPLVTTRVEAEAAENAAAEAESPALLLWTLDPLDWAIVMRLRTEETSIAGLAREFGRDPDDVAASLWRLQAKGWLAASGFSATRSRYTVAITPDRFDSIALHEDARDVADAYAGLASACAERMTDDWSAPAFVRLLTANVSDARAGGSGLYPNAGMRATGERVRLQPTGDVDGPPLVALRYGLGHGAIHAPRGGRLLVTHVLPEVVAFVKAVDKLFGGKEIDHVWLLGRAATYRVVTLLRLGPALPEVVIGEAGGEDGSTVIEALVDAGLIRHTRTEPDRLEATKWLETLVTAGRRARNGALRECLRFHAEHLRLMLSSPAVAEAVRSARERSEAMPSPGLVAGARDGGDAQGQGMDRGVMEAARIGLLDRHRGQIGVEAALATLEHHARTMTVRLGSEGLLATAGFGGRKFSDSLLTVRSTAIASAMSTVPSDGPGDAGGGRPGDPALAEAVLGCSLSVMDDAALQRAHVPRALLEAAEDGAVTSARALDAVVAVARSLQGSMRAGGVLFAPRFAEGTSPSDEIAAFLGDGDIGPAATVRAGDVLARWTVDRVRGARALLEVLGIDTLPLSATQRMPASQMPASQWEPLFGHPWQVGPATVRAVERAVTGAVVSRLREEAVPVWSAIWDDRLGPRPKGKADPWMRALRSGKGLVLDALIDKGPEVVAELDVSINRAVGAVRESPLTRGTLFARTRLEGSPTDARDLPKKWDPRTPGQWTPEHVALLRDAVIAVRQHGGLDSLG